MFFFFGLVPLLPLMGNLRVWFLSHSVQNVFIYMHFYSPNERSVGDSLPRAPRIVVVSTTHLFGKSFDCFQSLNFSKISKVPSLYLLSISILGIT